MHKAFVLGAGLGTRLKTLTERRPKPLLPLHQKALITYAFDHLVEAGASAFMVNTHHRPEAYPKAFPQPVYRDRPLAFRHEPIRLETGGGIANISDWLPDDEPFWVYNGDILSDLPLAGALRRHLDSDNLATLVLRHPRDSANVLFDADSGKVRDLRGRLGLGPEPGQGLLFTGIYLVDPGFLHYLQADTPESVVEAFLRVIQREDRIGGWVEDGGQWHDLGTRDAYLEASALLSREGQFPHYGARPEQQRLHPEAEIHPSAHVCPLSSIGAGARIGEGAIIENCILWENSVVREGAHLRDCIVRDGAEAEGHMSAVDL